MLSVVAFIHECVRVVIVDLFIYSVFSVMVVAPMLVTLTENTGRRSEAIEGGFLNRANARPDVCVCVIVELYYVSTLLYHHPRLQIRMNCELTSSPSFFLKLCLHNPLSVGSSAHTVDALAYVFVK